MKWQLSIAALCCAALMNAQEYLDDAQARAHINLETQLSRHFSVHLDQQYRFNQNVSNFRRGSADIGLIWRVNRHVRLLFDYIYIQRRTNDGYWQQRNWYSTAVVLRHNVRKWRFIYRNMVQFRGGTVNSDEAHNFRIYDRNKLTVRYEINKRLTAYTSGEVYLPLNNPQLLGIERSRNQVGMLFDVRKNQQLELYFMYQVFWQKGNWWDQSDRYPSPYNRRDFIYGIGYGIEF